MILPLPYYLCTYCLLPNQWRCNLSNKLSLETRLAPAQAAYRPHYGDTRLGNHTSMAPNSNTSLGFLVP